MADPTALGVVTACAQAFDYVGLPEGRFHLAQACLYLATAPKSNSAFALWDAIAVVENQREDEVPGHLKDSSRDAEDLGHGAGYLYPHAYRDHWVAQQYLPANLVGKVFYQPSDRGYEARIGDQVARRREAQLAAMIEDEAAPIALQGDRGHERRAAGPRADPWLQRTLSSVGQHLSAQRERVFAAAEVERHSLVLDINAGTGLLTWEAMRCAAAGGVWALAYDEAAAHGLRQQAAHLPELHRPVILCGTLPELPALIADEWRCQSPESGDRPGNASAVRFDVVVGRNALTQVGDKAAAFKVLADSLAPGGRLVLAEVVPSLAQRLYRLIDLSELDADLRDRLIAAEETIYGDTADPLVNWNAETLTAAARGAGLERVVAEQETQSDCRRLTAAHLARWFPEANPVSGRPPYSRRLERFLSATEIEQVRTLFARRLQDRDVDWRSTVVHLTARRAG
jgi:putative ATPase